MATAIATPLNRLAVALATKYTVSATTNVVGNVKEVTLTNLDTVARTVRLYFVPSSGAAADSNAIMKDVSIPAGTLVRLPFDTALENNATIQALCSVANMMVFSISVLEFGPTPTPFLKPQTPASLLTSSGSIYVVTPGKVGNVKELILSNVTGTDRTATVYYVPSGGAPGNDNTILSAVTVSANTMVRFPFNSYLGAGDTVRALCSVDNSISARVTAAEY